MPKLTGTGRIADDLYLLAHDDVTGKSFLQPRALGVGLAGALLAELMFAGAVWVRAEGIELPNRGLPPDDLGRVVLSLLLAERESHPLRDWLLYLSVDAEEHVARRLARAGYVAESSSRWPWHRTRWVPVDPDCAFGPVIRVTAVLAQARPATVADAVLTGLAVACGLGPRVLPFGPPEARRNVDAVIRMLHPGLRELIAQTQAAIDSAVLSHRV
jgi:hypothetical protein